MSQHLHERGVERLIDLLHDGVLDRLDRRRTPHLVGDTLQQPFRVVPFTEEAAIQFAEPSLALRSHEDERRCHEEVPRPAALQECRKAFVPVASPFRRPDPPPSPNAFVRTG